LTDLGIFAASSGSPRRSRKPLRNKGNSRFCLAGRREVALSTSGDRKFAGHELGSAACRGCEAVVTGEGRLDASSLEGKLPVAVARRAHALGLPVIGHFGCKGEGWESAARLFCWND
jgi:hypothetical protein